MSRRLPDWAWTLTGIALILVFWQFYGQFTNPFLFPALTRVLQQLWLYTATGEMVKAVLDTLVLLFTGLFLGIAVGVIGGLIIGASKRLSAILAPFLQAAYATPRIALIPVIILWVSIGFEAQVVLVFLSCVFEIMTATEAGVQEVSGQYLEVARSFRLSKTQTLFKVILPGSLAYILSGVRLGVSHAFVGAIGAQLFMQVTGMGSLLVQSMHLFRTDQIMAAILVMAAAAAFFMAATRWVERWAAPWRKEAFDDEG